jgi:fructose-bisphosphate aldolase class II
MTKINIATHLSTTYSQTLCERRWPDNPSMVDSRKYLGPARDAVAAEGERLLRLLNGF